MTTNEDEIVGHAVRWWASRRPVSWSRHDHLQNPTVNLPSDAEKDLARAVAALVRANDDRRVGS